MNTVRSMLLKMQYNHMAEEIYFKEWFLTA